MIVEFSLENRKALETQERRKEKIEVNVHLVPVIVMISASNCNDTTIISVPQFYNI